VPLLSFGQNTSERTLYIIDSIPVFKGFNKVEGADIVEDDIFSINTVTDLQKLAKFKAYNLNTIIYITTKRFANRPDSIQQIPSMRQMLVLDNKWCLKKNRIPYSGKYIDYYLNGQKQGEGRILNGKLDGKHLRFFKSGNVSKEINYDKGAYVKLELKFYKNGEIETRIESKNDKLDGKWESYYPNGVIKRRSMFKNGKINGKSSIYSSKGRLNSFIRYSNGIQLQSISQSRITRLNKEGYTLLRLGDLRGAIKSFDKIITIDSLYSDAYLTRAKAKIRLSELEDAILDLNTAINIEPFLLEAYTVRSFLIIKMFELNLNTIPIKEINKICADFRFFESYANYNNIKVKKAIKEYCE
jgi:tetratricopeptide (TPR) repeat protein